MTERPSPIEFMKQTAEADRSKENSRRTQEITKKIVENSGIIGGNIEEERSRLACQEIFKVFGTAYKPDESDSVVKGMEQLIESNITDRNKKIVEENLTVLSQAFFKSINLTCKNYPDGLITSALTAEQIDDFLPEEMKGLGKHVKEVDAEASEEDKKAIFEMDFSKSDKQAETQSGGDSEHNKKGRVINGEVVPDSVYADWLEQERQAEAEAEKKGDKESYKSPIWLMSAEDVVDEEMQQRGKQQFHLSPPYPQWFKELSQEQKDLWRVRCKLINGVAWKQIIRNKDVEKLMSNEAIDISRSELKVLYEMPNFKEALQTYLDDLFESNPEEGKNLLRIKREKGADRTRGTILDARVEEKIVHFQGYKEIMALKMQYPGKDEKYYSDLYQKYYLSENKKGAAKKLLASDEYRSAVAAAWSFLYIGNTLESADIDRHLSPCEVVSDKLRTMIHPMQKAMGKWGIYKEGAVESHRGVYNEGEKPSKYDKITGEEEPMGGPIAAWVKYNLEMDEVKDVKYENSFRKKMVEHVDGHRPFPPRMATSLVEMLMVNYEDGKGNLVMDTKKPWKGDEIPMSQAILEGKTITFDVVKTSEKNKNGEYIIKTKKQAVGDENTILSHEYEGHDYDTCVGFRDAMDGCFTAFNYLTGKVKFETKNMTAWSLGFDKDISLVRQNATKYYEGLDKPFNYLKFVDNPEFLAWVVAASTGFNYKSEGILLDYSAISCNGSNYYNCVKAIVDLPGLTKLSTNNIKIMEYLSAVGGPWKTNSYIERMKDIINKNDRKRVKYSRNNQSEEDLW